MEARERFKVEEYGGDCCDFEKSSVVADAFELLNPEDFPEDQRQIVGEFNRRAEIGNRRHRIAMYRAEMFEKGFNAGMYICTFDQNEDMTDFVFTDETRRLLGYDGLEDLPNEFDSWVKTLLPEQRDTMVPIFWNTVRNHRQLPDISHAEYPMVRKDGKIIWVTGAGRFIRRADGSLEIYMGCYRDVTAEHEKDDYLHIIEGIGKIFNFSLYIDMAAESYRIISTNEYVERVRKDPNAFRFLRDNVDSSVHPDYREELKKWFQPDVISALLTKKESISKDFFSSEANMWFRAVFMVGDRNGDGTPCHIIYGCQDITYEKTHEIRQRQQLEQAVESKRAELEKITVLNDRLREKQARLEEISAEHEAQLEEITALNTRLENNQAELEASVAEQQAQIEEIQKLNQSLAEYNDAMANAGYGMWHIILRDGAEPRMQVNEKMAELLGIAGRDLSEEALYHAWYDQIVPDAIPSVQASVGEMLAGNFSENTYRWVHPTKGVIYVRCGGTAGKLDDGTDYISGYHADVTDIVYKEKKHNEELVEARRKAEAANKAKSSFLFNMSHDIRTPMNAIIGYANLMKRNQGSMEKWPDYLDKILASSDFLLGLINNVLEMARIESGKTVLDENVYAADAFIDQLYSVFADEMGKKNIKFTKSVSVKHTYFYSDTVKLREIYLNIISNAQKYTMPGGRVDVSVEELPTDVEDYVMIRTVISDTGIGMSEEYLPHIFEEFSREKNSVGNKIQGTGLGMPIVRKLVDLMGGTIEVKSKLGEGTVFTVTIPHKIAKKPVREEKEEQISASDFAGKRILLAEDNDLNAEIATEILSECGFQIERAEDGVACVDMLAKAPAGYYDLILMDIQMPNLDGYGAARKIRDMDDPEKADIPIIAMTANAFDEDKRNAIDAGMDGHVAKPIEVPVLMKTLAYVFRDRSALKSMAAVSKAKEDPVDHVKRIYFEMQRSKAVSVLPGGFFAYMAEKPEKLIFANKLCCSIWGCRDFEEFRQLTGGSFQGVVHPDDYERAEQEIRRQIESGDTGLDQVKYRIIRKDGSVSHVSDYGRLVRDQEVGDIFYVFVAETPDARP